MTQRLTSCCESLSRAEDLERSVMNECNFVQINDNIYLYSDERAAVVDFFSLFNSETPIGVIYILMQGKLIANLIDNLRNHLITMGGITESQEERLNRAHFIRMGVYENIAYISL
jgi:hypothetical protein